MCDFDEFIFTCGHSVFRLKCYCHSARNDPLHYCNRVKKLRDCWDQGRECDDCAQRRLEQEEAMRRAQEQAYLAYLQSQGHGQGGNGTQS